MKLLRISSNEATAQFNNTLNADLILEPDSQIALANASFTPTPDELVVDASCDTITFRVADGAALRTALLEHRSYLADNSDTTSLLQDIERKLNDQLDLSVGKEFGGEFKVQSGSKIALYYSIQPFTFETSTDKSKDFQSLGNINVAGVNPEIILTQNGAAVDNDTNRVQSRDSIVKGAGAWRVRLNNLASNNSLNNGFKLVLTPSSLDDLGDTLSAEQDEYHIAIAPDENNLALFKYTFKKGTGIEADLTDGAGNLIRPNTPTQTDGKADSTNDVIQLSVQSGNVVGKIFQYAGVGNATEIEVFSVNYNDEDLHGLCIMRGGTAQIGVYNPRFTMHKSITSSNLSNITAEYLQNYPLSTVLSQSNGKSIIDPNYSTVAIADPPAPDNRQSNFTINFTNALAVARYCGLVSPTGSTGIIRNRPNYTDIATIGGVAPFNFIRTQNYVVEFQSSILESYDGSSFGRLGGALQKIGEGGQFSILKVVPNTNINNNNNQVNYEPATLAFIDLNNKEPLLLKNIRCRILDSSLKPIKQDDIGVLTLYMKPKSEII